MRHICFAIFLLSLLPVAVHADLTDADILFAETHLDSMLERTTGLEFAAMQVFTDLPAFPDVTVDVFGIGFCAPADPRLPPNPNPTPPLNAWGCQNDVAVAGQRIAPTEAEFTLMMANVFVAFRTLRDEAPACFECFGFGDCGTVVEDAYLLYSLTATLRASEVSGPSGRELHVEQGSVVVNLTRNALVLDDGCLATLIQAAGVDIDAGVRDAIRNEIEAFILPLPSTSPVAPATWGAVKSTYGVK
jgi:hypothetical protein